MSLDGNTAYLLLSRIKNSFPSTQFVFRRESVADPEKYILEWSGGPLKSDVRLCIPNNYSKYEECGLIELKRNDNAEPGIANTQPFAVKISVFGNPYTFYGLFDSSCSAISYAYDNFHIESAVAWPLKGWWNGQ